MNKPVNTRDTAGTGTVCHGVPKIKTVPVPALPVLETPRVFPYPCGTLLVFLDETRPFRVEADSSDFATGAVLQQQSPEDDKWHLVAYYSKSLSVVERNYEIHDKEMLAVI